MRRQRRPAPIEAFERFTIAHELGHYVLATQTGHRPRRESEYWLCESLCNEFASELLMPPRLFSSLEEPACAADLAAMVNRVAQRAGVTAEPAARAVVRHLATPIALGTLRLDPLPSTSRLGFRGWWAENRPWHGGHGGRRLAVRVNHPLAPILTTMSRLVRGETAEPELSGAASAFLRRRAGSSANFAALLA
jgi:hypothetical protein